MNCDRIVGYLLLFLGLSIILASVITAFSTFTGSKKPPDIFKLEKSTQPISIPGGMQIPNMEIVPTGYFNLSGNLMACFLLTWLLISAGGKIASIGVSMIKKQKT
ncbi:MAG: hypothetical protein U9Q22_07055 [Candidatus Altiarchaeota archaeon]|nr:hypothetical protein [Candidatus Altiarchaeota archaeon]